MTNVKRMRWVAIMLALAACAAQAQTVWTNAVNGLWSDATMWSAGVPNANAANLTAGNGAYTVTVDAPLANPAGALTITNNAVNTTRLDINAAGFAVSNGLLTLGRGALVSVNTGGEMTYPGTNYAGADFVTVKDGGEWQVNGGTVNFSDLMYGNIGNEYSKIYVGNASTGRLTMTSGTFNFTGRTTPAVNMVQLFLGYNGGYGIMQMDGGTSVLSHSGYSWMSTLVVGNTSSRGELTLTNNAILMSSNTMVSL